MFPVGLYPGLAHRQHPLNICLTEECTSENLVFMPHSSVMFRDLHICPQTDSVRERL